NEDAREHAHAHGDEWNDRERDAGQDGGFSLARRGRLDAEFQASIEGVGEDVIDGEKEGAPQVRAGVAPELGAQTGRDDSFHGFGLGFGGGLFLERPAESRTSSAPRASGFRCELFKEGRPEAPKGPRSSSRTRAESRPKVTVAPPLPSSLVTTP